MKKINIILLSVMILGLLTSCGKKAVDTAIDAETSEAVTETVEPTEKVSEADTEVDSEAVTEESETEAPKQEESNKEETTDNLNNEAAADSGNNTKSDKQTSTQQAQTQPEVTEQVTSEPTTPEPTTPEPVQTISYSPQNVVSLATAKVKAGGKTTLTDDLNNLLASGAITQEEYNEYYPYDGAGYYSIYVDTNMAEARDVSGTEHFNCEDDIATYIANMLLLENGDLFLIEYAGTYDYYGKQCYEFRCYRA